jgi:allantoin racemase
VKIWFQKHIVSGRLSGLDAAYEAHMTAVVRPGTVVEFHSLPPETYRSALPERYVRYGTVESLFAYYFSLQALRAEREGCDAFVIGTSQDPGLTDARAWAAIPVLGYGETAAHLAAMVGRRIGFVGFIPELEAPITENMRRYGLTDRLGPFAFLSVSPETMEQAFSGHPGVALDAFSAAVKSVSGEVDLVIPADGVTNELVYAAGLRKIAGVPVLDANGVLVRMAELFVDLWAAGQLGKPDVGYYHRRPDNAQVAHLLKLFAPKAAGEFPE